MNKGMESLFLENAPVELLSAAVIAAGLVTLVLLVKWLVINRLMAMAQRTRNTFDDSLASAARSTSLWLLAFPAVYIAASSLRLPDKVGDALRMLATLALLVQLGLWVLSLVNAWIERSEVSARASNAAMATGMAVMRFGAKVVVWSLVLLLVLDNLGIEVTALIAGLGIGGIAVALAVQTTLGDVLASLTILMDKPFAVGDFIVVENFMGTVENVGIKTTRVRSLEGEQIIFPNNDLLQTRIRNYQRQRERRVHFIINVLFQTPPEQLEQLPDILREIVTRQPHTRFERAHFKSIGESAFTFEVVYWMLKADYNLYMDTQQAINLAILRDFEAADVNLAYPTQKVIVSARPKEMPLEEADMASRAQAPRASH